MKKLIFILLLFTSLKTLAQQEAGISGTISDEKGAPLHGATVFLSKTKYVNVTDSKGRFSLTGLTPRNHEIVVKMIGFVPYIEKVYAGDKPVRLNVKLKADNRVLNDVTISAGDESRSRYLKLFTKYFIGDSIAPYCKILNPEELAFSYDKKTGVLRASTGRMLQIENEDLGYKLNYLFLNFSIDPNSGMNYKGYAYFEVLSGTDDQQKIWDMHRNAAHIESIDQFFKISFKSPPVSDYFLQKN